MDSNVPNAADWTCELGLTDALPRITHMGRSIFDPIWATHEHVSKPTELMHVVRGRVRVETPAYTVVGREHDTIYTPAGTPHRDVFPPGSVFEAYMVHFAWPAEARLLEHLTPPELSRLSGEARLEAAEDFDRLFREFERGAVLHEEMLALRVSQIILLMVREALRPADSETGGAGRSGRARIMTQARQVIDRMLGEPLSLDEIAEAVGVSSYYLSRVFSEQSGFTLSSYLTRRRMERACRLLAETDEPIKRVAAAVGYADSHYFSRVFRAQLGLAPSAYRAGRA